MLLLDMIPAKSATKVAAVNLVWQGQ